MPYPKSDIEKDGPCNFATLFLPLGAPLIGKVVFLLFWALKVVDKLVSVPAAQPALVEPRLDQRLVRLHVAPLLVLLKEGDSVAFFQRENFATMYDG